MTNTTEQGWVNDAILSIGPFINTGIYWLLAVSYNILLLIANSELFTSETIIQIFNRVQLVIGVFMVFRLTMLVLQGIINPDTFTDSKSGASNIIVRIITSLALLTLLVPINIPKSASEMNSFEKRINNNGLLFGILYDFQYRVLSQNLLGNLILGTGATDSDDNVLNSGDSMASTVLTSFFTPNLITSNYKYNSNNHYDDDDLFCKDYDYDKFYNTKNPSAILGMATESCDLKEVSGMGGYEGYAFNFSWFISLIVAIIFVVILLGMAVEVAKRAVKIAILRLIAPIPIISYMNPKSSMDNGSFGSWVKTLSSTYIELFINITIIYFAIFMINQIANGQLQFINSTSQKIGGFTILMAKVFIFIGILLFAKEAPKFIKQALGMKDEGGKGWFNGIVGALGLGAAGLGAIGSARTNYRASKEENDKLHPYSRWNAFRNIGSGLVGGMSGMVTGGKAAMTANDHQLKAAKDAISARNARRASHSTAFGRAQDSLYGLATGRSLADKGNKILDATKNTKDLIGKFKSGLEEAAIENGTFGTVDGYSFNYGKFAEAYNNADSKGNFDFGGKQYNTGMFRQGFLDDLKKDQVQRYIKGATRNGGKTYTQITSGTEKLASLKTDLESSLADSYTGVSDAFEFDQFSSYGKAIGVASTYISDTNTGSTREGMKQLKRNANKQEKK